MADTTLDPANSGGNPEDDGDESLANAEFPVPLDTLSVDGTNPQVGDEVEAKIGGKVTRIVNDMAYVKPETVNGEPLPANPINPNPATDEGTRLRNLSSQADSSGASIGGGSY